MARDVRVGVPHGHDDELALARGILHRTRQGRRRGRRGRAAAAQAHADDLDQRVVGGLDYPFGDVDIAAEALGPQDLDGIDHGFRDPRHALPVVGVGPCDARHVGPVPVVVRGVSVVVHKVGPLHHATYEVGVEGVHARVDDGDHRVGRAVGPDHVGADPGPTLLLERFRIVVVVEGLGLDRVDQRGLDGGGGLVRVGRRASVLRVDAPARRHGLRLRCIHFRDVRQEVRLGVHHAPLAAEPVHDRSHGHVLGEAHESDQGPSHDRHRLRYLGPGMDRRGGCLHGAEPRAGGELHDDLALLELRPLLGERRHHRRQERCSSTTHVSSSL